MRIFPVILVSLLASHTALGATIIIENESDWDIHFLYLSPSASDEWGPDQLGDDVIISGSRYKLKGVGCNTYDVLIVDEDSDECILSQIPMCTGKEYWEIGNDLLLSCQEETQGDDEGSGTMTLYNHFNSSI